MTASVRPAPQNILSTPLGDQIAIERLVRISLAPPIFAREIAFRPIGAVGSKGKVYVTISSLAADARGVQ